MGWVPNELARTIKKWKYKKRRQKLASQRKIKQYARRIIKVCQGHKGIWDDKWQCDVPVLKNTFVDDCK